MRGSHPQNAMLLIRSNIDIPITTTLPRHAKCAPIKVEELIQANGPWIAPSPRTWLPHTCTHATHSQEENPDGTLSDDFEFAATKDGSSDSCDTELLVPLMMLSFVCSHVLDCFGVHHTLLLPPRMLSRSKRSASPCAMEG